MLTGEDRRYLKRMTRSCPGTQTQRRAFRRGLKQELYALREECPGADYHTLCTVLGTPEPHPGMPVIGRLAAAAAAAVLALCLLAPGPQAPEAMLHAVVYTEGKLYLCAQPGCTADEDEVLQTALRMVGEMQ